MSYAATIARAQAAAPHVRDESERGQLRYIVRELGKFDSGRREEGPAMIVTRLEQIIRPYAAA